MDKRFTDERQQSLAKQWQNSANEELHLIDAIDRCCGSPYSVDLCRECLARARQSQEEHEQQKMIEQALAAHGYLCCQCHQEPPTPSGVLCNRCAALATCEGCGHELEDDELYRGLCAVCEDHSRTPVGPVDEGSARPGPGCEEAA